MSEIKIDNTPKSMPVLTQRQIDKFWREVLKTTNIEECWIWIGFKDKRGYGRASFRVDKKRTTIRAPRLAYYLHYKIGVESSIILHKCDNPSCCNPYHLSLGTNKENSVDMIAKGRGLNQFADGEKHPNSKLTVEIVQKLKEAYASGTTQKQLSIDYNIDPSAISRAINGKRWKSIYS